MDTTRCASFAGITGATCLFVVLLSACAPSGGDDSAAAVDSDPPAAVAGESLARQEAPRSRPAPQFVPGEFLVKFRGEATAARTSKILRDGALRTVATFRSLPGLRLVRADKAAASATQAITALARDRDVEYIEPNFIVHESVVPNDPRYVNLWAMNNTGQNGGNSPYHPHIDAEAAWDITTGSDDIVVGVVDTGVDYTHEDLAANMFRNEPECDADGVDDDGNGHVDDCHGIDTVANDSDPMDERFHGTHVAGTIGAVGNNGIGVVGVAWHVKMMPCRFLDEMGEGTTAGAIACFDYLAQMKDRGVNLIASNHSWGGPEYSRALHDALVAHRARGMLVVAAAGNDGHDSDMQPGYPCNYELSNVICVASTYEFRSYFSNYGTGTVHLGAPGETILSTTPNNGYDTYDGTSMATPHVTGALVLLAAQDPTRDWRTLRNLVITSTVPPQEFAIPSVSGGRLNLLKALTCTNSEVMARLQPATFETLHRAPGDSVVIRALHVNCGSPAGGLAVSVSSGEVIDLRDNGIAPDDVAGDGEYAGRWTASTPGTFTFSFPSPETETFQVLVDDMLEPGFPVRKNTVSDFDDPPGGQQAALAVGNVDADPELEIVADTLHYGPIHVLNHDGSDVPGWPFYQGNLTWGLSLGELDGDASGLEVVANQSYFGVHAYDRHATVLPGWPPHDGLGIGIQAPAPLVDIDGDGLDEVVTYPLRRADGTPWRTDVEVPAIPPIQQGFPNDPAVGDLDADGQPEFVLTNSSGNVMSIYASDRDGIRHGFPVRIPPDALAEGWPQVLIGDVDGDGSPNLIVPTWRRELTGAVHYQLMVLSNRGQWLRNIVTDTGSLYAALADLDGDGIPEIIRASENHLHAWRGDGTELSGWPASIVGGDFAGTTHPVIGDVDGDGHPDVVVGARFAGGKALHAIRHDGTSVAGFPKNFWGEGGSLNTPAIADIDLDGRNEIIVNATTGNGLREAVFVYDTLAPGPHGPLEWSQYMGGEKRRGYYETGKNLPNHAYVATQVYGAGGITAAGGGIDCGADCIERYAKGTNVVLQATARAGGTFAGWRGACEGQGNPCTLNMQQFAETSADFDSQVDVDVSGAGSVNSSMPGIACPGDCSEAFPARSMITLTAVETTTSDFTGWSGACSGTQETCKVFVDDAKDVGAGFASNYPLTVSKSGAGSAVVTSSVAGIDCGANCAADFPVRSTVRITLTPDVETRLVSWHRLGCLDYQLTCDITMNGPVALNIELALKPVMTVTVEGDGRLVVQPGGECTTSCRIPVDIGLVVLTAIPDAGGEFLGFAGLCAGQGNIPNCNHYMNGNVAVRAVFAGIPRLTLDFQGAGAGRVRGPAGLECTEDCETRIATPQVVSLTATVGSNSVFGGWSGACSGTALTCEVAFTANTTVGVTFNVAPPPPPPPPPPRPPSGGGGGRVDFLLLAALALLTMHGIARSRRTRVNR